MQLLKFVASIKFRKVRKQFVKTPFNHFNRVHCLSRNMYLWSIECPWNPRAISLYISNDFIERNFTLTDKWQSFIGRLDLAGCTFAVYRESIIQCTNTQAKHLSHRTPNYNKKSLYTIIPCALANDESGHWIWCTIKRKCWYENVSR